MSRNETTTGTHSTKEPIIMENTRSPYRPNVRRLTSPRTQRRIRFDILSAWAGALAVSLSLWAAFFHLIAR